MGSFNNIAAKPNPKIGHKNNHREALTGSIFSKYNHNCTAPIETGTTSQNKEPSKRKSNVFCDESNKNS